MPRKTSMKPDAKAALSAVRAASALLRKAQARAACMSARILG